MVNYQESRLNAVFSAMADPTRRAILARLAGGDSAVTRLAEPFSISPPAISRHLRVLESAGLISRRVEGRIHRCRLEAGPMKEAAQWIEFYQRFWEERLDALGEFLTDTEPGEEHKDGKCKDE